MPMTEPTPNHWIIVSSIDNFRKTRELGFTVQGMKSRHRKKVERMVPGDRIAYYVTGRKAFGAIATITSPYFESHDRIWQSDVLKKMAEDDYPFRVEIRPEFVLDESDFLPAEGVARRMQYASKWPAANWTLAFQGNVHEIGEEDFRLILEEMEARVPAGTGGQRQGA